MVKFRDVVVQDTVLLLLGQILGVLRQDAPATTARSNRCAGNRSPTSGGADVAHILHLEGNPVVLESRVDVLAEILARHLLELAPSVIHARWRLYA